MKCPKCKGSIRRTETMEGGSWVRRGKICKGCGRAYWTLEILLEARGRLNPRVCSIIAERGQKILEDLHDPGDSNAMS